MIEYAPRTKECTGYNTAWLYCITLEHNGYYDWRLPTHAEYYDSPIIMSWFEAGIRMPGRDWKFYVTPVRTKDD
jgi:hypothetical protein